MPLTFAHPAAVIPLRKAGPGWFNMAALVLGSMAPDFEYFIRLQPQGLIGHRFIGFMVFNLPMVFVAALLWHYVIKAPLSLSLPHPVRHYFTLILTSKPDISNIKTFTIFVTSALTGMASHVFWDAFTHVNGYFVNKIDFLLYHINVFGNNIPVYKILQHGSTFIGFLIIFLFIHKNRVKHPDLLTESTLPKSLIYWLSVSIITIGVVILRFLLTANEIKTGQYGILIVSAISGFLIGILMISGVFKLLKIYS